MLLLLQQVSLQSLLQPRVFIQDHLILLMQLLHQSSHLLSKTLRLILSEISILLQIDYRSSSDLQLVLLLLNHLPTSHQFLLQLEDLMVAHYLNYIMIIQMLFTMML